MYFARTAPEIGRHCKKGGEPPRLHGPATREAEAPHRSPKRSTGRARNLTRLPNAWNMTKTDYDRPGEQDAGLRQDTDRNGPASHASLTSKSSSANEATGPGKPERLRLRKPEKRRRTEELTTEREERSESRGGESRSQHEKGSPWGKGPATTPTTARRHPKGSQGYRHKRKEERTDRSGESKPHKGGPELNRIYRYE